MDKKSPDSMSGDDDDFITRFRESIYTPAVRVEEHLFDKFVGDRIATMESNDEKVKKMIKDKDEELEQKWIKLEETQNYFHDIVTRRLVPRKK